MAKWYSGTLGPKTSRHLSYRWGKTSKKPHLGNLYRPGIEPGSAAWQARMLPPLRWWCPCKFYEICLSFTNNFSPFRLPSLPEYITWKVMKENICYFLNWIYVRYGLGNPYARRPRRLRRPIVLTSIWRMDDMKVILQCRVMLAGPFIAVPLSPALPQDSFCEL